MWQELPPHTRTWSEQDWEDFFEEQEQLHRSLMCEEDLHSDFPEPLLTDTPYDPSDFGDGCPDESCEEDAADEDCIDGDLREIPAWCSAADFGDRVHEYVSPLCRRQIAGPRDFILHMLCHQSFLVQDYIAAGHEIGYEEDTLRGNIALCIRALRALDRCVQGLERVLAQDDTCRDLLVRALVTRGFVIRRIADLRALVWWQ